MPNLDPALVAIVSWNRSTRKGESVCLSVCLSVRMFVRLSVYACLSGGSACFKHHTHSLRQLKPMPKPEPRRCQRPGFTADIWDSEPAPGMSFLPTWDFGIRFKSETMGTVVFGRDFWF